MPRSPVDPGVFLRSFLVVAGVYCALFFSLLMAMLGLARLAFPEVYRLWNLPPESREQFRDAWENRGEVFFPAGLCLGLIGAALVLSLVAGLLVARLAPFSRAGHGVFLAILCIVTWLQITLTQPQIPGWLGFGMLLVSPAAIVVAARWGERLWGVIDVSAEDDPGDAPPPGNTPP
jgi:hypothetical protein